MPATIQQILKPTRARGLDTSGNNNHAQIYSGRALEFDGVTDYLSVTGAAAGKTFIDYSAETTAANRAWTVAVWLNYDAAGSSNQMISGRDNSIDVSVSNFLRLTNTEKLGFYDIGGDDSRTGDTVLQPKTWYRAVFVYNGSDTVNFYLNGVADGSGTLTPSDTNNNADLNISLIGGSITSSELDVPFAGKMSDFQAWQGAWTAADAEYDYLNPEQLVLNRGGTSLTNSNLKLWYPMNDGHRPNTDNQTSILDASNTGLGDNLIANPDFETDSTGGNHIATDENSNNALNDWFILTAGNYSSGFSIDTFFSSTEFGGNKICKIINANAGGNVGIASNAISFQSGKTYKVSYTYRASGSGVKGKVANSKTGTGGSHVGGSEQQSLNNTTKTDHSYFFTATETETNYVTFIVPDGVTFEVDNVSIQIVNDKHSATTEFYGDDLFDDGVGDYSDSTGAWVAEPGNSVDNNDSALRIIFDSDGAGSGTGDDDGARLNLNDAADLKEDLVVGRTYQIEFEYKINQVTAPNVPLQINQGDSETFTNVTLTQTSFTEVIRTFTCTGSSPAIKLNNMNSGDIVHLKNFTLKEVGVASGWTDADQQLDIPQTALQSYNQLGFSLGSESSPNGSINCGATTSTSWTTVDVWFYPMLSSQGQSQGIFDQVAWNGDDGDGGTGGYGFRATINTSDKAQLTRRTSSGTFTDNLNSTSTVKYGEWNHLIVVIPKSDDTSTRMILNGHYEQQQSTGDHGTTSKDFKLGYGGGINLDSMPGVIGQASYFKAHMSKTEMYELYNNGTPFDARNHSLSADLVGYWRNNGINGKTWTNLANPGTNDGTPGTLITETMLITAGVDSSRDSQGFFMNRQRTTNSLNLDFIGIDNTNILASEARTFKSNDFDFGTGHISVDAWIKTRQTGEGGFIVTCQSNSYQKEGFGLRISGGNDIWFVAGDGSKFYSATEGTDVNDNEWHHICGVYDSTGGSQSAKYYLDGVLKNTDTTTTDFAGTPNTDAGDLGAINVTSDATDFHGLSIGGQSWNAVNTTNQDFEGQIDDVKVYKGKALTADEVLRNYNAGKRSHR